MTKTMSLAQAKAKPPKRKGKKTGRPPTAKDAPAQKERSAFDTVRLLVIANPAIAMAEAKAQLEAAGKKLADSSISTALYDMKRVMLLLKEFNS